MYIYGLYVDDPADIRYVGKTCNTLEWRLMKHRRAAIGGHRQPVYDWVRKYGAENLKIRVLCLAATQEDLDGAEIWMIAELRSIGCRLLNATDGGEGWRKGMRHSEESRRKISEARKGMKFTDEHRANISRTSRGKAKSVEARANMTIGQRVRRQQERVARLASQNSKDSIWTSLH